MRLRNITGSEELIKASRHVCAKPQMYRGRWRELWGNENPLHLEVGMGKGLFLREMAARSPGINFIGIEKYSSVVWRAVQRLERLPAPPENLRLVWLDARNLAEVFAPGEVAAMYINFCDPWPKDRHAHRRITARPYLAIYDAILDDGGRIAIKTDNEQLYRFSLSEAGAAGWRIVAASEDLHGDAALSAGNVMSEYEAKFSERGNKIFGLIIEKGR